VKIWKVWGDVHKYTHLAQTNCLVAENGVTFSTIPEFDGTEFGDSWPRIEVDFYDKEVEIKIGNFYDVGLGGVGIACDDITLEKINHSIRDEVEYLPIYKPDMRLNLLNITNIIDCLNVGGSNVKYSSDGIHIIYEKKLAFYTDKLIGVNLFKIPELVYSHDFATDRFKNLIESAGLTGLEFQLVYDDEQ
jgi:hypothetical protein